MDKSVRIYDSASRVSGGYVEVVESGRVSAINIQVKDAGFLTSVNLDLESALGLKAAIDDAIERLKARQAVKNG